MEQYNESCELLSPTGNESSDDFQHFLKKRQYKRIRRTRTFPAEQKLSSPLPNGCFFKLCMPLVCLFFLGMTIWVLILAWAGTQLRIEVQSLQNFTKTVSAGSEGIPESIQKCHSLTRQLEKNQTKIINQLQNVAQKLTSFTNMINGIQADLSKVEKKLDEALPQLNVPNTLQSLTTNVASFRDQLDELQSRATSVTDNQIQMKSLIHTLKSNLTTVYNDLEDLKRRSGRPPPSDESIKQDVVNLVIEKIKPNITRVNTTLWSQVKWLSDDLHKAQKVINNLTDEAAFLKSHIFTIHDELKDQKNNLKLLRSDVKDHNNEWNELLGVTKTLQSNMSKFLSTCSQCKVLYNEESTTGISPFSSHSEMASSFLPANV